ncbi:MAG: hypothetical protein N5P05_003983 [Chroococcopsis gigantea SAG 12.99]|jgi:regulator of sirC expression with transglutaminase-like and TPR domain|nr:hypothetical protein [Chroococcopsis gigantea SAG 12.99]
MYQAFKQEVQQPPSEINLALASLLIAQLEYRYLDINKYLNTFYLMTDKIKERLSSTRYPLKTVHVINQYLYEDLNFTGNGRDYYNPDNSYLNQVLDNRTGIPLSLSVIYLEIAERLNFPMVGIGLPGHFLIRPSFEDVGIFVDPFNRGEILFEQDCELRLHQVYQQPVKLEKHFLAPVSKSQILIRMLTNLKQIYINRNEPGKAIRMIDLLLILIPDHPLEKRDRGLIYYQIGNIEGARSDLNFYLELLPHAQDAATIRQLLQQMG